MDRFVDVVRVFLALRKVLGLFHITIIPLWDNRVFIIDHSAVSSLAIILLPKKRKGKVQTWHVALFHVTRKTYTFYNAFFKERTNLAHKKRRKSGLRVTYAPAPSHAAHWGLNSQRC